MRVQSDRYLRFDRHFYMIGENGIVEKHTVSDEVWNALWPWAVSHGIYIAHYVSRFGAIRKIRWRNK